MEGVVLPTSWPLAAQGRAARRTTAVVSSSGRAGRQLEGRASARSSSLRPAGERESEERERGRVKRTERQRERGEDLTPSACFSAQQFRAFPFHSDCDATIELYSPAHLPVSRVSTRACSARVGCARGLRACATGERERERERSCGRGSNYPSCRNARPFDRGT